MLADPSDKSTRGGTSGNVGPLLFLALLVGAAWFLAPAQDDPPTPPTSTTVAPTSPIVPTAAERSTPIRLRDLLTGDVYTARSPADARERVDSRLYEPLTHADAARIPATHRRASPASTSDVEPLRAESASAASRESAGRASPVVVVPPAPADRSVHVSGYTRRDGTYVAPYDRRAPRR